MNTQDGHESVGAFLKREREAKNLSLKDVATSINVRAGQLEAIESGNIAELPGMVYAIGFVRSYAVQLGLDGDEIARLFKEEHAASAPKQAELNISPPPRDTHLPSHFILAASGVGLVLILALWFLFSGGDEETGAEKMVPDVPAQMQAGYDDTGILQNAEISITSTDTPDGTHDLLAAETDIAAQTTAITEETTEDAAVTAATDSMAETETAPTDIIPVEERQAPIPPPVTQRSQRIISDIQTGESFGNRRGNSRIVLIARDSSWVQVRDGSGQTLFQQVLRPGQSYYVPRGENTKLATANAGGIDVYVDGKKMPPFGKKGDIIRGISLDADEILKRHTGR
ncbi:MAG: helix-turn-helix domain-containing protein [Pseudomonadota bacterium]|nr:helix-turn-helix domain-containing protein [Pseudomonadota bacterium]QKK04592.1 MAG: helix-turn-helix domain-containing protein [Pseudomonadota bacterium]